MAPKAHEYLSGTWGDRLTKYDVGSIQYNEAGYPTMYRGHVLSWEKGNLQYFDNTDFIYNDSGIRIEMFNCTVISVYTLFVELFGKDLITKLPLFVDNATRGSGHTPITIPVLRRFVIIKL